MEPKMIRVLVVDDHVIVRKGLRALFGEVGGIEVVGEAKDGQEAVEQAAALRPDVVLIDLVMPRMDGITAIALISEKNPGVRMLALTSFATDEMVFPAIKAGALGYILKDSDPDELVRAVKKVHRGEPSLHPRIARMVLQEVGAPAEYPPTPEPLTARELEVLKLVAQGLDNDQIAAELVVAEVTVRTHVSHILGKLQLANRVQAALYALREGLASLE